MLCILPVPADDPTRSKGIGIISNKSSETSKDLDSKYRQVLLIKDNSLLTCISVVHTVAPYQLAGFDTQPAAVISTSHLNSTSRIYNVGCFPTSLED